MSWQAGGPSCSPCMTPATGDRAGCRGCAPHPTLWVTPPAHTSDSLGLQGSPRNSPSPCWRSSTSGATPSTRKCGKQPLGQRGGPGALAAGTLGRASPPLGLRASLPGSQHTRSPELLHQDVLEHSSSVVPFSSCLQSFPASGSFPRNQFFPSGDQSIGASASASVLPMNIQD